MYSCRHISVVSCTSVPSSPSPSQQLQNSCSEDKLRREEGGWEDVMVRRDREDVMVRRDREDVMRGRMRRWWENVIRTRGCDEGEDEKMWWGGGWEDVMRGRMRRYDEGEDKKMWWGGRWEVWWGGGWEDVIVEREDVMRKEREHEDMCWTKCWTTLEHTNLLINLPKHF